MKKILLYGAMLLAFPAISQTLFQEDFESGSGNWTLNGGSGDNQWIVNNIYAADDFGVTAVTPDQPAAISGGPQSSYLHIHNTTMCSSMNGCNATFSTGSASDQRATMNGTIVTTGYTNINLSFYYLSAGQAGVSYGTVEYSTDNGVTWTPIMATYVNTPGWTNTSVSTSAWANQASLKFRFRWQNGSSGEDPAFAIDQITITGQQASSASIATLAVTPPAWCFNSAQNLLVAFNVTGTVDAGNVYTAQLSNTTGSFATPVNIGTLISSATGSLTINAIVPAGTPIGTGYRIRVIASDPAALGTDNGSNLTIQSCLGIDEAATAAFTLYPNPTTGTVNIAWNGANSSEKIRLLDYSGRLLDEITLQNNAFSLEAYPAGSYLVQLASNGQTHIERITKK